MTDPTTPPKVGGLPPEPCGFPPENAGNHGPDPPARNFDLDFKIPTGPPPAPPPPLLRLWNSLTGRWAKVLFAVVFVVVATFHFKDQRLAREAEKAEKAEPAALTQPDPNAVPEGWKTLSDLELARYGFRRITPAEAARLIFPGGIVVKVGKQATPGYRVVHVEGGYAFLEDLGDSGNYLALPVTFLEKKRVPELMPPPPPLPKTR